MYYEEKIIGGILCYRESPDGEWTPVPEEWKIEEDKKDIPAVSAAVTELERQYHFGDGTMSSFKNVVQVGLHGDKVTHVIWTEDGFVHYIPQGWKTVSIKPVTPIVPVAPQKEESAETALSMQDLQDMRLDVAIDSIDTETALMQ